MIAAHALEYVALAAALLGLAGVFAEIIVKDPRVLGDWTGGHPAGRSALRATV